MWRILPYLPEPRRELTRVRRQALALVRSDVVGLEVGVDWVVFEGAHHLLDGVRDEDEGDEAGEALLREACHVFDDVTGVGGHQEETLQAGVDADPQTQLHVVDAVVPLRGRGQRSYPVCIHMLSVFITRTYAGLRCSGSDIHSHS